ncbi:histone-like nucleoid-structuring protein Lsr2 [Pseudonocardia lacus]|uniref:histone-like nucleoid-structuring protein Lsr2 n=1 Tax=Pseudonocardia lacus TaxID=2835865 RepID=UPI001BDCFEBA|nr:Lsr2 family protein [Pseudonocardia lacus]
MAQKVETRLVDDLDGSEAAETVRFALEGRQYEIDLSEDNAARLRNSLADFVASARRAGGARGVRAAASGSGVAAPSRKATDREHGAAVREWARANGFEVSSRGRISTEILTAYEQRS